VASVDFNNKIHVLFLLVSQSVGGAETHAIALANGLDKAYFRVSLVYLKDEHDGFDFAACLREEVTSFCGYVSKKVDIAAARKLARFVDDELVDLIVCTNPFPLLYGTLLRIACARKPKLVEILHSTIPLDGKQRAQMNLLRPLFWLSDLLVYVCENQCNYWKKNLLRARACQVIHNGVDVARFRNEFSLSQRAQFRAAHGFQADDYVVGACGNLRPEKAQGDLVEAIALAHARGLVAKCLLIGDGSMRKSIERLIADRGLATEIAITGIVTDVRLSIASCDVMAVPSHHETFSMAALEAMALGKPVIMSDVGGARELIRHGVNGYLYQKGDIKSLADLLVVLGDAGLREEAGKSALKTVIQGFTAQTMVQVYSDTFMRLVQGESVASNVYP
jgi:glycosyltransferase involved in cell wall biosynthesis